jgi:CRP-like cAMP-binding protein
MEFPLTQELVADALGLTSVHVNRTLQVLRETGAVEWKGGRLTIPDLARLQQMADFNPTYLHLRRS